jgi:hypothetical protein
MMMQSAKKTHTHSRDSSSDSSSDINSDSSSSSSDRRRHRKQPKRAAALAPSVAATRAICRVLNAAGPDAAHLAVVLRPTLTLQRQAPVLGARGRGALLDTQQHINRMRANWPRLLRCELQAIQEDLCKRIRLAARAAATGLPNTDAAVASDHAATASYARGSMGTALVAKDGRLPARSVAIFRQPSSLRLELTGIALALEDCPGEEDLNILTDSLSSMYLLKSMQRGDFPLSLHRYPAQRAACGQTT